MDLPKVTAIVINWNNYSDTKDCIESFQRLSYDNINITVIDNGSTDGSAQKLQNEFSDVNLSILDENLGFPAGVNAGIANVDDTDYIWLVNSDIIFERDRTLRRLVKRMEENPSVGIVSPQINYYPNTDEVWFEQGVFNRKAGLTYTSSQYKWYLHGPTVDPQINTDMEDRLIYNDYVPFACSLIRTDLIEDIGNLDERYFLYKEDVDYCQRAKRQGYAVVTDPEVLVYHKVSASSGGAYGPIHTYYNLRNRWLLAREYAPEHSYRFYVFYAYWAVVLIGYFILKRRPKSVFALAQATKDGALGQFGKGPYP